MGRFAVIPIVFMLLTACDRTSEVAESPEPPAPDLFVRCGGLIDGLGTDIDRNRIVVVREQRIESIRRGDSEIPVKADVLDLSDYTCLPGLIDTHVHFDTLPRDADDYRVFLQRTPADNRALAEENAAVTLRSGFTTVRSPGSYLKWLDRDLRDRIDASEVVGPRMQIAGPYLTVPHGGGDMYIPGIDDSDVPGYYRAGVSRNAEEFRAKAEEFVAGGADYLKVIASGAVFAHGGIPGAPEMTREEIAAVVDVAHAAGIKVTAHAHGAESIKDAILAGVDSIEHASLGDDEAVALAVEHDVALSMDVYNGTYTEDVGYEHGYAEEFMRKNEETTEVQRVFFEKALDAGATILFGTDLGVLPHDMGAYQFEVMVERGMPALDAIKSATTVAAEHMGMHEDVGALEVGRFGDLIAVRGNPLDNIAALQDVDVVIKGGEIVVAPGDAGMRYADTVYHTGKIYTVNPEQPWAQAVAVRKGRIVFVGSDDNVREHIGPDTEVHDLRGRMMLPGFQDSHVHPWYGGLEAISCSLDGLSGLSGYRATIAECAELNPDEKWITGGGWFMSEFGPGGAPSKHIIDELVPERPVFLMSVDGHTAWVNSAALRIAGITPNTPDPQGGIIDRDPETNEITGSLQEDSAIALVRQHIPKPGHEKIISALEYARDLMHGYGITSVQDAWHTEVEYEPYLDAYRELDRAGELNLRVVAALVWDNARNEEQIPGLVSLRERYMRGDIRPISVKMYIDGVMENYTAAMLEPYLVESGTSGIPMVEPESLKEAVSLLAAEGFQVHFHSLGDAAVRSALDAVEESTSRNDNTDLRHHLSHLQVINPDDLPRFAGLGAVANFQPLWAMADEYITELTLPFVSEEIANWIYPIKSVIDAGGRVAFGSDWPVSSVNPLPQIETAITRIDADTHATQVMNPEQRITLEQAIEAFTINAAFINHQDDESGSIETGKYADLVVLDKNLFEIEASEISEAKVVLTLFAGKPVYGSLTEDKPDL